MWLDDVSPPFDLDSGPYTPLIIYILYIIAAILVIKINCFEGRNIHTRRGRGHAGVLDDMLLLLFQMYISMSISSFSRS